MAISTDKFDGVDLSRLPAPQVVETLDFDTVKSALMADLLLLYPEFSALTPADPAVKLIELFAYRELLLRVQMNEASLSNMLAFAADADLDHIAPRANLERFIISAGNPEQGISPPLETDADFRARIVRAPEGWSVAGPVGAYVDLATKASSNVRFASCTSPAPCQVLVTIQSRIGNGTANPALLVNVADYLNSEDRRPLTDHVTVQSATILQFQIVANIRTFSGPDVGLILSNARAKLQAWLIDNQRLDRDITADGIHAQLRVEGVSLVSLVGWTDVICNASQAGYCTNIILNHTGAGQ